MEAEAESPRFTANPVTDDYARVQGTAKHAADSLPENPDPAKRQRTTALSRQGQQQTNVKIEDEAPPEDRNTHSEKPSALEDLVNKASDILDLVKAGGDLRKDMERWKRLVSAKQLEARDLEQQIHSGRDDLLLLAHEREALERRVTDLHEEKVVLQGRIRTMHALVCGAEKMVKVNTRLQADLEASKQETARLKDWLNNGSVEIFTRFPGVKFVRRGSFKLGGVPGSQGDKNNLGTAGSNGDKVSDNSKS